MFTRRTRLLISGGIMTLIFIGAVIFQSPDPTRTVDEVMDDPSSYVDREVSIRGEVLDGSIDNSTMVFILHGTNHQIYIDFSDASVSNGLDDNRTVYAKGILKHSSDALGSDSDYVLVAELIKTSCPSKYEE